jgi:hypothetical protein
MNLARRCWIFSEWSGVITNDTVVRFRLATSAVGDAGEMDFETDIGGDPRSDDDRPAKYLGDECAGLEGRRSPERVDCAPSSTHYFDAPRRCRLF